MPEDLSMKKKSRFHGLWIIAMAVLGILPLSEARGDISKPEELVERAQITLESFVTNPNCTWLRDHLKEARAVLIVPQILKGAFIVGGAGGSGVVSVRDERTGTWSPPAFYTLGSASIGLQIGAHASEVILMVMTPSGIDALYSSTFKLGGDATVALGPVGLGVEGSTPHNLSADFLSFSRSRGAFAGMSLDGTVIAARDDWNEQYYGKPVKPVDILLLRKVNNPHADKLLSTLARLAR